MVHAGAKPTTWNSVHCELQRDWNRTKTVPGFVQTFIEHGQRGLVLESGGAAAAHKVNNANNAIAGLAMQARRRSSKGETIIKLAFNIAGVLLGLIFNVVALNFSFTSLKCPRRPPIRRPLCFWGDDSHRLFRFCEGARNCSGPLVAFPRTQPLGLLTLGPITHDYVPRVERRSRGGQQRGRRR